MNLFYRLRMTGLFFVLMVFLQNGYGVTGFRWNDYEKETFNDIDERTFDCWDLENSNIWSGQVTPVFLGSFSSPGMPHSIFKTLGKYGSLTSKQSIWSPFGIYGNQRSDFSVNNSESPYPPIIHLRDKRKIKLQAQSDFKKNTLSPNFLRTCYKKVFPH